MILRRSPCSSSPLASHIALSTMESSSASSVGVWARTAGLKSAAPSLSSKKNSSLPSIWRRAIWGSSSSTPPPRIATQSLLIVKSTSSGNSLFYKWSQIWIMIRLFSVLCTSLMMPKLTTRLFGEPLKMLLLLVYITWHWLRSANLNGPRWHRSQSRWLQGWTPSCKREQLRQSKEPLQLPISLTSCRVSDRERTRTCIRESSSSSSRGNPRFSLKRPMLSFALNLSSMFSTHWLPTARMTLVCTRYTLLKI